MSIKNWKITNADNYLGFPSPDEEKQGFVYALEYGDCVKIGRTQNLSERIHTLVYQAENYSRVIAKHVAYSISHSNYVSNENELHKFFKSKQVGKGELFAVSFEDFLKTVPKLKFEKIHYLENTRYLEFLDWYFKDLFEETTGLPYELFLEYENAETQEQKDFVMRKTQAELEALTMRQHLIKSCKGITEEEIQKCLECL